MIRIIIGIFLVFTGVAGMLSEPAEGTGRLENMLIAFFLVILPGVLLIYYGQKSRKRSKKIIGASYRMIREKGNIEADLLAQELNCSISDILKTVTKARKKGLIPKETKVFDPKEENSRGADVVSSASIEKNEDQKQTKETINDDSTKENIDAEKIASDRGMPHKEVEDNIDNDYKKESFTPEPEGAFSPKPEKNEVLGAVKKIGKGLFVLGKFGVMTVGAIAAVAGALSGSSSGQSKSSTKKSNFKKKEQKSRNWPKTTKVCATCDYWGGDRKPNMPNKPQKVVGVEDFGHCSAKKVKTSNGAKCDKYVLWGRLKG